MPDPEKRHPKEPLVQKPTTAQQLESLFSAGNYLSGGEEVVEHFLVRVAPAERRGLHLLNLYDLLTMAHVQVFQPDPELFDTVGTSVVPDIAGGRRIEYVVKLVDMLLRPVLTIAPEGDKPCQQPHDVTVEVFADDTNVLYWEGPTGRTIINGIDDAGNAAYTAGLLAKHISFDRIIALGDQAFSAILDTF